MKKVIFGIVAAILLAGTIVIANNQMNQSEDCCKAGAECCYPGSPCCEK